MSKTPATSVIQCRCDVRELAALAAFYDANKILPESKSALVSQCVGHLEEILRTAEKLAPPLSTEDSLVYLESLYGSVNVSGRGRVSVLKQIAHENAVAMIANSLPAEEKKNA
jgi:hypothetical protein